MKCGKLTAKLRDAVPVCFIEEGKEIKRVKNIEIPDAIKELEYKGFKFDVPMSGAITFKIYFEPGTLPESWPEPRQRKSRTPKADPEPMPAEPVQDAVAALTDALEQAREEGQPVDEIAQAAADGAEITTEIMRPRMAAMRSSLPPRMSPMMSRCRKPWRFTTTYPAAPARPWPAPSARSSAHTPAIRPPPASPTSSANTPWIGTAY